MDAFLAARLQREGLTMAPAADKRTRCGQGHPIWTRAPDADKTTLLRRVTLDLSGLPPTLGKIDAYLVDESPDAYEWVVDRLLAHHAAGSGRRLGDSARSAQ